MLAVAPPLLSRRLIRRVSEHADSVDNALVASYGGSLGGTP